MGWGETALPRRPALAVARADMVLLAKTVLAAAAIALAIVGAGAVGLVRAPGTEPTGLDRTGVGPAYEMTLPEDLFEAEMPRPRHASPVTVQEPAQPAPEPRAREPQTREEPRARESVDPTEPVVKVPQQEPEEDFIEGLVDDVLSTSEGLLGAP